jgi:hypothetical protein
MFLACDARIESNRGLTAEVKRRKMNGIESVHARTDRNNPANITYSESVRLPDGSFWVKSPATAESLPVGILKREAKLLTSPG